MAQARRIQRAGQARQAGARTRGQSMVAGQSHHQAVFPQRQRLNRRAQVAVQPGKGQVDIPCFPPPRTLEQRDLERLLQHLDLLAQRRLRHPQVLSPHANHDAKRAALALDLDLRRPVKHAGRNSTGIWGVNRQGCRFSRPAPWMARGGGPPNTCRITGTPSLGEVPSVGARALCLLWGFSKVSRRKGGTISSRYLNNGYVPSLIQHSGRLSGRLRGQASSHSFESRGNSQSVVGC